MLIPRFRLGGEPPCVVEVAPDGTVAQSVGCHRCGYDLRTLHAAGNCPECNTPVRASLRGDQLWFSDPRWIARVALGAELFAYGGIGGFVACVIYSIGRTPWLQTIGKAGIFAGIGLILVGSWLLTSPDPSGVDVARYANVRRAARGLLLIGFLALPLDTLGHWFPPGLVHALASICVFAGFFGIVAFLSYLYGLILRIPDFRLAEKVKMEFTVIFICIAWLAIVRVACALIPALDRAPQSFKPIACCAGLPFLVLFGSCVTLIWSTRTIAATLRREATMSRRFWPGKIDAAEQSAPS